MVIGPTPPGTGVIAPATSLRAAEIDVADQFAVDPVDADVDHGRAGLEPVALDHVGPADRGDDDVAAADHVGKVAGAAVGDGDRAILPEQQLRHRLADDVRAADHDRLEPAEVAEPVLEHHDAAQRRARHQRILADRELAGIVDVKAVDILGRIDRADHRFLVDLAGQRQLDEDAVDARRRR